MKEIRKDKKSFGLIILSICILVIILLIGGSFALWSDSFIGSENTIKSGTISFLYTEPSSDIDLITNNSDDDSIKTESTNYVEFSVSGIATDKVDLAYYIYFSENSGNTVTKDKVKFYLTEVNNNVETKVTEIISGSNIVPINLSTLTKDTSSSNYLLYGGSMNFPTGGSTIIKVYRLRFWISGSDDGNITYVEDDNKHTASISGSYSIKLNVYTSLGEVKTIS